MLLSLYNYRVRVAAIPTLLSVVLTLYLISSTLSHAMFRSSESTQVVLKDI